MPVTEYATIPLASASAIDDSTSPAGKNWQATLDTVSSQSGFQRAYYGIHAENQHLLQLLIDWDSLADHEAFMKDSNYQPFVKRLMTIVDGSILMQHASFTPYPPAAAVSNTRSPVTEVITAYFQVLDDSFHDKFKQFGDFAVANASGCKAAAGGWIIEDVQHNKLDKNGKAFVGLIGWESVDAHKAFRETKGFQDNIHLLRGGEIKAMEVHHTSFTEK